jgi:hypothetical protein
MDRPPVRADHIGSLLRPAPLRQAFRAFHAGEIDEARFVAAQDAAIRDAIKMQQEMSFAAARTGAASSNAPRGSMSRTRVFISATSKVMSSPSPRRS